MSSLSIMAKELRLLTRDHRALAVLLKLKEKNAHTIFGALAVLSYAAFLTLVTRKTVSHETVEALNPEAISERPRVWLLVILEWAIFLTTHLWFLGVALTLPT